MNRFRRDFLAAYISASSDPATYGKITVLTIPGQVNGPKLANNAITTDTAVSQDLGVIGRDNQNRIRWGNLLTLPVAEGGLLYVEPVYASPGASDAASSYPRLIRVAMMYNDRVGYGPTVRDALHRAVRSGRRRDGHRPRAGRAGERATAGRAAAADGQPRGGAAAEPGPGARGAVPVAVPPGGVPVQLSAAKAAALQEVQSALDAVHAGPAERQLRRVRRRRCSASTTRWTSTTAPSSCVASVRVRAIRHGRDSGAFTARSRSAAMAIWRCTRAFGNLAFTDAGWSSSVARWAHNPEVAGSNPVPATR